MMMLLSDKQRLRNLATHSLSENEGTEIEDVLQKNRKQFRIYSDFGHNKQHKASKPQNAFKSK